MNRRHLLTLVAGSTFGLSFGNASSSAQEQRSELDGMFKATPNTELQLATASSPVIDGDSRFNLVRLGKCKLTLGDDGHLTALVSAGVAQYTNIDYWISLAVFDERRSFLGAATHKVAIQCIRRGVMPTLLPELEFDFGISNKFRTLTQIAVAISDRDVPRPG